MNPYTLPWRLVQNKIVRYPGGREIDRFRGVTPAKDDGRPEAWVGSDARTINAAEKGDPNDGCAECILPGGERRYLFEVVREAPDAVLGPQHRHLSGDGLGVLVKLLDAEKQLGLQSHPTREYARTWFNSPYGKEESWYIIGLRDDSPEPPYVLLGFKENVTRADFERGYDAGDIRAMEQCCHKIPVSVGDVFFIQAGAPHAVGCGCFMVEVQEPSDITVGARKLSDSPYTSDAATPEAEAAHKERLLGCYLYDGGDYEANLRRFRIPPHTLREGAWGREEILIGPKQTAYFSFTRLSVDTEAPLLRTGFIQIAIVLEGEGELVCGDTRMPIKKADELFLPYNIADTVVRATKGPLSLVLCNPPGVEFGE